MAKYESEHTKFMREWLEKNPTELVEKEKGRALWWDKTPRDLTTQKIDVQWLHSAPQSRLCGSQAAVGKI